MAKKDEAIFIGIDNERIELTGEAKEAFLADRKASADARAVLEAEAQTQKELKISAYKKLGLTDEEIAAII